MATVGRRVEGALLVGGEPVSRDLHPAPQDLMLRHGWRTGAIIPELEREIRIINTEQYMHSLTWQQALTGLLERMQVRAGGCLAGGMVLLLATHSSVHLISPRPTRTPSHGRCWLPG